MEVNTKVNLSGLILDNPVIPASGTFGFGKEYVNFYDINILGSISIKGTTVQRRKGNPQPRIAECYSGLINSVGLENPGMEIVIQKELKDLEKIYRKPVIANISGFSVEEYVTLAREMDKVDNVIRICAKCESTMIYIWTADVHFDDTDIINLIHFSS